MRPRCRCGCPHEAHLHYRRGTNCSRCGWRQCPSYRPPRTTLGDVLWIGRAALALWRTRHYLMETS